MPKMLGLDKARSAVTETMVSTMTNNSLAMVYTALGNDLAFLTISWEETFK
jgi:hypothetical protein